MATQLHKKLSIKNVIGKVKALFEKDEKGDIPEGQKVNLIRVIGIADGIKVGTSTYGEWIAFTGQFVAIDLRTGEEHRSGQLFLPDTATDVLAPVVRAQNGAPVEFAFDIGATSTDTEVGYEYNVTPLVEAKENDPLQNLTARLNLPALPAPVKKAEPEADKAKAEGKKK